MTATAGVVALRFEAGALHAKGVHVVLMNGDSERPHRGDRRLGVRGAAEAADERLALAHRADQHRPVRD